jgi:mannose-1-phosphate guanylyltransferase
LAAALYAIANDKNAILVVVSSSYYLIPDIRVFHDILSSGLKEVLDGKNVIMEIYPTHPETGYD